MSKLGLPMRLPVGGQNRTAGIVLSVMVMGAGVAIAATPAQAEEPAAPPPTAASAPAHTSDPLEPINRVTSSFNRLIRAAFVDPIIDWYQEITPKPVQNAVSNAASNLTEPITAVSSLLQGDTENAATSTKRFFINTTVGLGGTSDKAREMGLEQRREDLGQAAGAGGAGGGVHLVLPIIGPSNLCDAVGDIATFAVNPLSPAVSATQAGAEYADRQEAIQAIGRGSADPYIAEREAYEQNRRFLIRNGEVTADSLPEIPDEDDEPGR